MIKLFLVGLVQNSSPKWLHQDILLTPYSPSSPSLQMTDQFRSVKARKGQDRLGQVRKGQVRTCQVKTGKLRTGHVRSSENRSSQGR